MVSRFLLNLRETSSSTGFDDDDVHSRYTRNERNVFGNLGGDLVHGFSDSSSGGGHSHEIEFARTTSHSDVWNRRRRSTIATVPESIAMRELGNKRTSRNMSDESDLKGDKTDTDSKDFTQYVSSRLRAFLQVADASLSSTTIHEVHDM